MKAILLTLLTVFTVTSHAASRKSILFVLTNEASLGANGKSSGIHFNELTHPHAAFTSAGFTVVFASPKGGVAPIDPATLELQDPINNKFYRNPSLRRKLAQTFRVDALRARDFAGIFLVGGVSTMWDFPNSPALDSLVAQVYEQGSVVGAVCHGPAGLVNVKLRNGKYLVSGKSVSSFTNEEETVRSRENVVPFLLESRLVELGAKFTKAAPFKYHVVTDGRLVTGQNPASAFGVAHEMISVLSAK